MDASLSGLMPSLAMGDKKPSSLIDRPPFQSMSGAPLASATHAPVYPYERQRWHASAGSCERLRSCSCVERYASTTDHATLGPPCDAQSLTTCGNNEAHQRMT